MTAPTRLGISRGQITFFQANQPVVSSAMISMTVMRRGISAAEAILRAESVGGFRSRRVTSLTLLPDRNSTPTVRWACLFASSPSSQPVASEAFAQRRP